MPNIESKSFKRPFFLLNGHFETIYASVYRKIPEVKYVRERIDTRDKDFLDLDWMRNKNKRIAILCHGLEGSSQRTYMRGMASALSKSGYDVLAWNNRSCSGEMNLNLRLYHHADIEDLEDIINHVLIRYNYKDIVLIGFSMGGSQIIKYLGINGNNVPDQIKTAVTFSVPCNLGDSARALESFSNAFYRKRFLSRLKEKIRKKHQTFGDTINISGLDEIKNFAAFDSKYTAPIHGFSSADEFYRQGSAVHFIEGICIPVLLVNAKNDPMFTKSCYPYDLAEKHKYFHLEVPKKGGHVGFYNGKYDIIWSEKRAIEFLCQHN